MLQVAETQVQSEPGADRGAAGELSDASGEPTGDRQTQRPRRRGDEHESVVAEGFCTGTPLRGQIEVRADLSVTTQTVGAAMTARLGEGPASAPMSAYVVQARSHRGG